MGAGVYTLQPHSPPSCLICFAIQLISLQRRTQRHRKLFFFLYWYIIAGRIGVGPIFSALAHVSNKGTQNGRRFVKDTFFSRHIIQRNCFFVLFFSHPTFQKFHFQKAGSYYSNQYNLGSNRHTVTAPEVSVGSGVMIHSNRDPRKLQTFKSRAAVHMVKVLRHSYENAPA